MVLVRISDRALAPGGRERGAKWRRVLVLWALLCAMPVLVAVAGAATVQLTSEPSGSCVVLHIASNAAGDLVTFESDCDYLGTNGDGNREIFQVDDQGSVAQLTDTAACANTSPSSSMAGDVVAFDSDCDLDGGNSDQSVEIFLSRSAGIDQLTSGDVDCSSLAPSVNGAGTLIAFDSDCDPVATNGDRSSEIFQVSTSGVVAQLTDDRSGSGCGSFDASSNSAGDLVAFDSDCDLAGTNPDEISEIFQVSSDGVVSQLTTASDDTCMSIAPASNAAGDKIAFESDCDYAGSNTDGSVEVFRVSSVGTVEQLSDDGGDPLCESTSPDINDDGQVVVYTSFCDPVGLNSDGSWELFRTGSGGSTQLTNADSCSSFEPAINGRGRLTTLGSDCDPLATNADGGDEVFQQGLCRCGAPVSGNLAPEDPTASDALFALKAAVGITQCDLCECDVDDGGTITATDALRILRSAVGLPADLICPS